MLIECINFIIDNAYIIHKGVIYKQVIGIPMGNNAGPHLANIYLHVYELAYINRLSGDNASDPSLSRLSNIFRFQDDLLMCNDNGLFGRVLSEIYPPEMIVNNTNINPMKCSYLDLLISVQHNKFIYELFDKRNDFDFQVITFPFICGNIPSSPSYGVYISQLLRYCNVNSKFECFQNDVIELTNKLCKQGFNRDELCRKFDKFYNAYIGTWSKFGVELMEYKNILLGIKIN